MIPFDFQPQTRIVFGPDTIDSLGALAAELGCRRALVVSDPGVIAVGHTSRGCESLQQAGSQTTVFDGFSENPSTDDVNRGLAAANDFQPDMVIGLGGGSSMDCAKGINFVFTNGGEMKDYWGVGKATKPMLPMIAVPTTAGTGSETQSFALISDATTHVKMACGDKKAACAVAILDPKLTLTLPQRVTALTGVDAISHALETYVTKKRNSASLAFSREGWRLLAASFTRVLDDPHDLSARGEMLLGASFAGLAIENSMLGAAHALANPLTASFGIAHGQAVGVVLPHVMRFNGEQFGDWYHELAETAGDVTDAISADDGLDAFCQFVQSLVARSGLQTSLKQLNVPFDQIDTLAEAATKQWTAGFNPRELDAASLAAIYRNAFE